MPLARCCAAIPKQRDSLMLSYTLGFPFREMSSCCHTSRAFHSERRPYVVIQARSPMQRDVLMLSYKPGFPFREMSLCCHTRWALPMQRDFLMLSYKMGCNPDFPCIAAGGT